MSPERVLVDTSAWIMSFKKGGDNSTRDYLKQQIAAGFVVTAPFIILELLQGCKTERERDDLRLRLESLDFLDSTNNVWERAYSLAFELKRKGVTVPTVDILIAALALENDCLLLHFDRHFIIIGGHFKELKLNSMAPLR